MNTVTKDLSGRTFGDLTVIAFDGFKGDTPKHSYWLCQCICGETRSVRGTDLVRLKTLRCVKCSTAQGVKKRSALVSLPPTEAAIRSLIGQYKSNAKRRNLDFSLDRASLEKLFFGPCTYCGVLPSEVHRPKPNRGGVLHNGIDRAVNSEGYTSKNAVSCCSTCNFAKREMGTAQFLEWVHRVVLHQARVNV